MEKKNNVGWKDERWIGLFVNAKKGCVQKSATKKKSAQNQRMELMDQWESISKKH